MSKEKRRKDSTASEKGVNYPSTTTRVVDRVVDKSGTKKRIKSREEGLRRLFFRSEDQSYSLLLFGERETTIDDLFPSGLETPQHERRKSAFFCRRTICLWTQKKISISKVMPPPLLFFLPFALAVLR